MQCGAWNPWGGLITVGIVLPIARTKMERIREEKHGGHEALIDPVSSVVLLCGACALFRATSEVASLHPYSQHSLVTQSHFRCGTVAPRAPAFNCDIHDMYLLYGIDVFIRSFTASQSLFWRAIL